MSINVELNKKFNYLVKKRYKINSFNNISLQGCDDILHRVWLYMVLHNRSEQEVDNFEEAYQVPHRINIPRPFKLERF